MAQHDQRTVDIATGVVQDSILGPLYFLKSKAMIFAVRIRSVPPFGSAESIDAEHLKAMAMESVPPRGSGWVSADYTGFLAEQRPTRYREVVLTSFLSQLLK